MPFMGDSNRNWLPGAGDRGPTRRCAGFSLLELVVTVTVAAVVLALAAPNFRSFIQNNRVRAATEDFLTAVHVARTEAIKRGEPILLCRTGDPGAEPGSLACRANEPGGGANQNKDWTPGWVMYAKPGYTGTGGSGGDYDNGTDGEPIAVGRPAPSGVTIRANGAGNNWLAFFADGSLNESGSAMYVVCDDRGTEYGRQVLIPPVGRPYLSSPASCNP